MFVDLITNLDNNLFDYSEGVCQQGISLLDVDLITNLDNKLFDYSEGVCQQGISLLESDIKPKLNSCSSDLGSQQEYFYEGCDVQRLGR